jgi:hypothetical protein
LKSHAQEWNFGESRTSGARIPRAGGSHRLLADAGEKSLGENIKDISELKDQGALSKEGLSAAMAKPIAEV